MTVQQLIAKLKKMPQNQKVFLADHDHGEYEVSSPANSVYAVNKADISDIAEAGYCNHAGKVTANEQNRFDTTPTKYVVIRA